MSRSCGLCEGFYFEKSLSGCQMYFNACFNLPNVLQVVPANRAELPLSPHLTPGTVDLLHWNQRGLWEDKARWFWWVSFHLCLFQMKCASSRRLQHPSGFKSLCRLQETSVLGLNSHQNLYPTTDWCFVVKKINVQGFLACFSPLGAWWSTPTSGEIYLGSNLNWIGLCLTHRTSAEASETSSSRWNCPPVVIVDVLRWAENTGNMR